jgi:acyl-coenzyme A synthetase/AMP-(fatty) acid ligase
VLTADPAARRLHRPVLVTTAGAPPPPSVIARTETLGFQINHVYGLTETYRPVTICEWNPAWDERPKAFVTLCAGATLTGEELIAFSRETLPGFKAPSEVEFGDLPKPRPARSRSTSFDRAQQERTVQAR